MLKNMGLDAYRFSISWSRVLPGIENNNFYEILRRCEIFATTVNKVLGFLFRCILLIFFLSSGGNLNAGVNKEGINYYNNLIDELLANGRILIIFLD